MFLIPFIYQIWGYSQRSYKLGFRTFGRAVLSGRYTIAIFGYHDFKVFCAYNMVSLQANRDKKHILLITVFILHLFFSMKSFRITRHEFYPRIPPWPIASKHQKFTDRGDITINYTSFIRLLLSQSFGLKYYE